MKGIIAVPTSSHFYLPKKFALDLMELRLVFDKFYPNTTFIFSEFAWIEDARNILWQKTQKLNADWLLMIDSDMTFEPKLGIKLVKELLDKNLDMLTGLYFAGAEPHMPLIYKETDNEDPGLEITYYSDYPRTENLFKVDACGFGFCVIGKKPLETLSSHPFNRLSCWSKEKLEWNQLGEDLSFCRQMKDCGFKIWCDSDINPGHLRLTTIDKDYLRSPFR